MTLYNNTTEKGRNERISQKINRKFDCSFKKFRHLSIKHKRSLTIKHKRSFSEVMRDQAAGKDATLFLAKTAEKNGRPMDSLNFL
jgi:hypothetical protein